MANGNDIDIQFARALVKLAREFKMDHLTVKFQDSVRARRSEGSWNRLPVEMNWSEGRHGAENKIGLRYETYTAVDENED